MEALAEETLRSSLESMNDGELEDLAWYVGQGMRDVREGRRSTTFDLKPPPGLDKLRRGMQKDLDALVRKVESGKLSVKAYDRQAHDLVSTNFRQAYEKGRGIPLDAGDEEWLSRAAGEELGYARKFGRDAKADRLVMPREKRAGMYGNTLEGISSHAQVESLPDECRLSWILGKAEHCPDCLILAANSPYTKWDLPSTPRAGATKCLCITTPESRVLTKRGAIPICKVRVGDWVLTHRGRWRRVTATHIYKPELHHRQARVVAPTGRIVGCTADHEFLTDRAWMSIFTIDKLQLPMYTMPHELRNLWEEDSFGREDGDMCGVQVGVSDLWSREGPSCGRVRFMRYETQGKTSVGGYILAQEDPQRLASRWQEAKAAIRRFAIRVVLYAQERRKGLRILLGRDTQAVYLSLPVVVGGGVWTDFFWQGITSYQRRCVGRQVGKSKVDDQLETQCPSFPGKEQSEVERWSAGVGLSELWDGISSSAKDGHGRTKVLFQGLCGRGEIQEEDCAGVRLVREGIRAHTDRAQKVQGKILFTDVLSRGTLLHDLTVEDDESFVVENLVVHNSNCKCKLRVTTGVLSKDEMADAAEYALRKDQSLSEMMERPRPPKGLRHPDEREQRYIDSLRHRINTNRRLIASAELDSAEMKAAIRARKRANDALIEFMEKEKVYDVPVWSVDEVLDERDVGRRVVKDIFRHGLDGRSLGMVEKRRLSALLDRYEREVGETFSTRAIEAGLRGK